MLIECGKLDGLGLFWRCWALGLRFMCSDEICWPQRKAVTNSRERQTAAASNAGDSQKRSAMYTSVLFLQVSECSLAAAARCLPQVSERARPGHHHLHTAQAARRQRGKAVGRVEETRRANEQIHQLAQLPALLGRRRRRRRRRHHCRWLWPAPLSFHGADNTARIKK